MYQTIETKRPLGHIRWMIHRDMPQVLSIEKGVQEHPWCKEEFISHLRQKNCIAMISEDGDDIVGFMVYELNKGRLELINMAVHPRYLRCGVATEMINKIKLKLTTNRRRSITVAVRETNLTMQLFLKSQGFLARKVKRRYFGDSNEDAFIMSFEQPRMLLGSHRLH